MGAIFCSAPVIVPRDRFYTRQEKQQEQRSRRLKALLVFGNTNAEAIHYRMEEPPSLCSQTQDEFKDLSAWHPTERDCFGFNTLN